MCGIAGVFNFGSQRPIEKKWLEDMNFLQRHRGPDDAGIYINGNIGIANRRLAISDRAHGHQPMSNAAGTVWITYNGEIFGHEALRTELQGRGHQFRTRADTETVLHAYEEFGQDCVERLNGQFAFAIWDGEENSLFLARDRLGIAPLHYSVIQGQFVFSSEIKAILAHPDAQRMADRQSLAEATLCGTLFDGRTMFENIRSLEPGYTMSVSDAGIKTRRYWDVPLSPDASGGDSAGDYRDSMLPLLEDALKIRIPDEVPWGVMLSGGTDSSTLCSLAMKLSQRPPDTFTIDYPTRWKTRDRDVHYAELMASRLGTQHHTFVIDPERYFSVLQDLVWHIEKPFNKGAASMYLLYERMREHATVIISGEGSDELFAGYVGSRGLGLDEILQRGSIDCFPWAPHWELAGSLFSGDYASPAWLKDLFSQRLSESLARSKTPDLLNRALYLYCKHFLLELLDIHDRTAGAFGLESRVPFLDHRFVERFFPMASDLKYRHGTTKYLFKEAIRDLLPAEIIERRKSHLPIPRDPGSVYSQLRLARDLLLAPGARTAQYYDLGRVKDFLDRSNAYSGVDMVAVWQISHLLITIELVHRAFRL